MSDELAVASKRKINKSRREFDHGCEYEYMYVILQIYLRIYIKSKTNERWNVQQMYATFCGA